MSLNKKSEKVTLNFDILTGKYGYGFEVTNLDTGETRYFDNGLDFPWVAVGFGWDGDMWSTSVLPALNFLKKNVGKVIEDPGFFDAARGVGEKDLEVQGSKNLFYDEIDKKFHDHPLLAGYKNASKVRENLQKYSQDLSAMDFSNAFSLKNGLQKHDLRTMVMEASRAISDVFASLDMPIFPKISLRDTKEVKYAAHNPSEVSDGVINFNVEIRSLSGVKKTATVPVAICEGEVVPPSIMEVQGSIYLISQDSVDDIIERITSYKLENLRENMFTPPLSRSEKEIAVKVRNEVGWQPIEKDHKNFMQQRSSNKKAVKSTPPGFEEVVEEMREAQEKLEDTFPRPYAYIFRNYISKHVSMASKNSWEPHLINLGLCLNPWGKGPSSRAVVTANKKEASFVVNMQDLEGEEFNSYEEAVAAIQEVYGQDAQDMAAKQNSLGQYTSPKTIIDQWANMFVQDVGDIQLAASKEADLEKEIEFDVVDQPVEVDEAFQPDSIFYDSIKKENI